PTRPPLPHHYTQDRHCSLTSRVPRTVVSITFFTDASNVVLTPHYQYVSCWYSERAIQSRHALVMNRRHLRSCYGQETQEEGQHEQLLPDRVSRKTGVAAAEEQRRDHRPVSRRSQHGGRRRRG